MGGGALTIHCSPPLLCVRLLLQLASITIIINNQDCLQYQHKKWKKIRQTVFDGLPLGGGHNMPFTKKDHKVVEEMLNFLGKMGKERGEDAH